MTLSENTFPATTRAAVPYGQGRARGLGADVLGVHGVEMDNLVALGLPVVASRRRTFGALEEVHARTPARGAAAA